MGSNVAISNRVAQRIGRLSTLCLAGLMALTLDPNYAHAQSVPETGSKTLGSSDESGPDDDSSQNDNGLVENAANVLGSWQQTRTNGSCFAFLEFIESYPNSAFALRARSEADRVCSESDVAAFKAGVNTENSENRNIPWAVAPTDPANLPQFDSPSAAWDAVREAHSCEAYTQYVIVFPDALFRVRAESYIEELCPSDPSEAASTSTPGQTPAPGQYLDFDRDLWILPK